MSEPVDTSATPQRRTTPEIDVLIVGAGPTGLSAAIELGLRGVRVLVVERGARAGRAPRAKTTNVRTRTHLRRWGVADQLAAAAPFGVDYPNDMVFVTRMSGYELARFDDAFNAAPVRSPLYPEHAQWIPQYSLERVLLEKVRTLPCVDVRFGASLVGARQDADGVVATVRTDRADEQVACRYLIGADGANSLTRDLIGATMVGRRNLNHSYNIIFRAPGLAEAHGFGPAVVYWQINEDGFSTIGPMDRDDVWFFMPSGIDPKVPPTDEVARRLIAKTTGIDLPYEVLSIDGWTAHELVADRYRLGHMMLAGDACHLHPPAGGYGMNMGVGDGVDLGWKLAATLQGWGGPALIDSYEAERRPIHQAIIEEAIANYAIYLERPTGDVEENSPCGEVARARLREKILGSKAREFRTLGSVLGLGYERSPIIAHEVGKAPLHRAEVYEPTARPGYLLPHAWLADGASLYDGLGIGFSLVVAADVDRSTIEAVQLDAAAASVPLTVVRPEGLDVVGLLGARLVLVRPDQHVAWRGERWSNPLALATGGEARAKQPAPRYAEFATSSGLGRGRPLTAFGEVG